MVIVAYRADEQLAGCLATLDAALDAKPGDGLQVIVVDNAAAGSTAAIAARAGARYVAAPGNVGYARAVNRAIRAAGAGGRDVLLLNPDARLDPTGLRELQRALHRPDARRAAVGPRLVDADGRVAPADWPLPSPAQVWLDALGLGRCWRGRRFVTGAVLLLSDAALHDVGLLDERYFLYAEEADWQVRAQRAGWSVAVVPQVTAVHAGGASSADPRRREQLFHASARAFARRWYGPAGAAAMWAGSLVAAARRSVLGPAASRRSARHAMRLLLLLRGGDRP